MFILGNTAIRVASGCSANRLMKINSKNNKEPKADKLDEEANNNNLGTILKGFQAFSGLIATA